MPSAKAAAKTAAQPTNHAEIAAGRKGLALLAALAVVAAGLLAACSSGSSTTGSVSATQTHTPTPTRTSTPTPTDTPAPQVPRLTVMSSVLPAVVRVGAPLVNGGFDPSQGRVVGNAPGTFVLQPSDFVFVSYAGDTEVTVWVCNPAYVPSSTTLSGTYAQHQQYTFNAVLSSPSNTEHC